MSAQPEYVPFAKYVPGPPLSDYIDILWIYEGYNVPHMQERLMPTGNMELVFPLDGSRRIQAALSGVQSKFIILDTSTPFSIMGVHFKPGGAFPFFGMPAGEFQDLGVPLEAVWGAQAEAVQEQLLEAKTRNGKFRILEHALLARCRGRLGKHPAVPYALNAFADADACHSVADVTQQIGLSARRFIEVFRKEVGLTPKVYSRLQRFRKVLDVLHRTPDPDLADVALEFGYFDQAHFIHEFRSFSGLNPSTYLRHRSLHLNHVPILD